MQKLAELIYAVRNQEGGFPWRSRLVTRWKHEGSFQVAGNVLFLNQVVVTKGGVQFVKICRTVIYDLCSFSMEIVHQYKFFKIKK